MTVDRLGDRRAAVPDQVADVLQPDIVRAEHRLRTQRPRRRVGSLRPSQVALGDCSASNWSVSCIRGSGRSGDGHLGAHGQSGRVRVRVRGSFDLPALDLQAVVYDHPAPFETAFGERVQGGAQIGRTGELLAEDGRCLKGSVEAR
jgi:hypothetical protein